jgi:hypothetical protein
VFYVVFELMRERWAARRRRRHDERHPPSGHGVPHPTRA